MNGRAKLRSRKRVFTQLPFVEQLPMLGWFASPYQSNIIYRLGWKIKVPQHIKSWAHLSTGRADRVFSDSLGCTVAQRGRSLWIGPTLLCSHTHGVRAKREKSLTRVFACYPSRPQG